SGGTPATVALERAGVEFNVRSFDNDIAPGESGYGKAAAAALGVSEQRVFKTLLVEANGPVRHAVAVVPVSGQLSLKAMAVAIGAKRVDMLEARTAERITGYVVGGISPFGQKKPLPTVVDSSALDHETIFVSGGKRGLDIEIAPRALTDVLGAINAAIST
ncbi:MAG: hypothetical protein RL726_480, partial [Actinomycetota bacterium]